MTSKDSIIERNIAGRPVCLFTSDPAAAKAAPLILVCTSSHGGADEKTAAREEAAALGGCIRSLTDRPFALAVSGGTDWDDDLSPWPAPAVMRGGADFGGGADAWLGMLAGKVLPGIREALDDAANAAPSCLVLGGYSLAGLFALYAMYRTDLFSRIVSASGSLWYPDFAEYALSHEPVRRPDCVYLSLGDREAKTRHPLMRTVEDRTRRLYEAYKKAGIESVFELNPGNHFQQTTERLAKGLAWTLGHVKK